MALDPSGALDIAHSALNLIAQKEGAVVAKAMVIVQYEDRTVDVSGPLDNKLVAYGMLEQARDAIFQWHVDNQRLVQLVPPGSKVVE